MLVWRGCCANGPAPLLPLPTTPRPRPASNYSNQEGAIQNHHSRDYTNRGTTRTHSDSSEPSRQRRTAAAAAAEPEPKLNGFARPAHSPDPAATRSRRIPRARLPFPDFHERPFAADVLLRDAAAHDATAIELFRTCTQTVTCVCPHTFTTRHNCLVLYQINVGVQTYTMAAAKLRSAVA